MRRPIKARAFTVSAETHGPNSTTGSFFKRKKRSSPCGPYFPRAFQCGGCAQPHSPKDPSRAKHLPTQVCPTSLAPCLSPRPQAVERPISRKVSSQSSALILHTLQNFIQCHIWVFEVLFSQFQSRFISSQHVVFASWIKEILSTVSCRLHFPKGFRFLAFVWLLNSHCPTHFFSVIVQVLPFAAKGLPISVYQGRSPPVLSNVINSDTRFFDANLFCSQRQFLGTFLIDTSGPFSSNFGLRTSNDLVPSSKQPTTKAQRSST